MALASCLVGGAYANAESPPPGFQDEVVLETREAGREHPTNFKFAPDGRIFVATKGDKILVYPPGATTAAQAEIFADLAEPTYDNGDHGLLGSALDPKFDEGRAYVYALYSFNHELGLPPDVAMPEFSSSGSGVSAFEGDFCPTRSTVARFVFNGPAGAEFHCRLDSRKSAACQSPRVYRRLRSGGTSCASTRRRQTVTAAR